MAKLTRAEKDKARYIELNSLDRVLTEKELVELQYLEKKMEANERIPGPKIETIIPTIYGKIIVDEIGVKWRNPEIYIKAKREAEALEQLSLF